MPLEVNSNAGGNPALKINKKNPKFLRTNRKFGRGTRIEVDQYFYYLNILDTMKNGFEDIEEKVNMANSVFEQTKGQELFLASNQIVGKVMQSLIGFIDAENLESYFDIFADKFRPICSNRYASQVLQEMIEIAFLRSVRKDLLKQDHSESKHAKEEVEDEHEEPLTKKLKLNKDLSKENYNLETNFMQEHKTNCGNFLIRVGKFMLNNLEDFVWNSSASRIMRTSILCLSGIHVAKGPGIIAKQRKIYEVSSEWHEVVKEFAQRLEMWSQFNDLPYQENSSAVLVDLCVALNIIDTKMLNDLGEMILKALLKTNTGEDEKFQNIEILDDVEKKRKGVQRNKEQKTDHKDDSAREKESKLAKVFEQKCSIILLEALLTVADPKLLTQLYIMLFNKKVALLAKEPLTSFAVQKLLLSVKEKEDFENIFQELKDHIEELLKIGHTIVITSLVSACLRLQTKQDQLIVALQAALHVNNDKERLKSLFLCLSQLKPFEILQQDKSTFLHLPGSLLIQDILRFNNPIFMVNCILETKQDYLVAAFNTPNGSYICDAFLQSKFIDEKSRDKFLKHLEGFYVDMAITKHGSRAVESCFASAHEAQKANIVKDLADKSNKLKSSPFGNFINNKLRVDTYRLSADRLKEDAKSE